MRGKYNHYTEEFRVQCILEYENGKSISAIAKEHRLPRTSVKNWCLRSKDNILAEHYANKRRRTDGSKACEAEIAIIPEEAMPRKISGEDLKKENKALREENEYLKDKVAYLEALYEIIKQDPSSVMKKRFSAIRKAVESGRKNIRRLCGIAGVSPKCYYQSLKPKRKDADDALLLEEIARMQEEHGRCLGYRKMAMELSKKLGIAVNEKRVERIMRENGLLSNVRRKKYSEEVYAARRDLRSLWIPDLIGRRFFSFYPRTRFVEDITYLPALEGNLYLNTIEDMFNGEIVAWKISEHPDTKLCLDTVDMLASELGDAISGIILHSDCGSTYVSYAYREKLIGLGIRMSMGSKGSCYENAAMESLNGIIKTEALYSEFGKAAVNGKRVHRENIVRKVEWFIDYYNNRRCKKYLGKLPPVEFRKRNPNGICIVAFDEAKH